MILGAVEDIKSLGLSKSFLLEVVNVILNGMRGKGTISDMQWWATKKKLVLFLALIQGNKQVKDKERRQKYQCWIMYCL